MPSPWFPHGQRFKPRGPLPPQGLSWTRAFTTQLGRLSEVWALPALSKSQIPKPGGLQEKPGLQHCGKSTELGVRGTWVQIPLLSLTRHSN